MKKRMRTIGAIILVVKLVLDILAVSDMGIKLLLIVSDVIFLGILYYLVYKLLYIEELLLSINRKE